MTAFLDITLLPTDVMVLLLEFRSFSMNELDIVNPLESAWNQKPVYSSFL